MNLPYDPHERILFYVGAVIVGVAITGAMFIVGCVLNAIVLLWWRG